MFEKLGQLVGGFTGEAFSLGSATRATIFMIGAGILIMGIGSLLNGTAAIVAASKRELEEQELAAAAATEVVTEDLVKDENVPNPLEMMTTLREMPLLVAEEKLVATEDGSSKETPNVQTE